ncbi:MAG: Lrp/AsnC family transcriptional regulator [Dehalococcoidia bacterium]|nr:Lrp/AsnC family transcriptional regulator [Dehalococcoidia bacterium]
MPRTRARRRTRAHALDELDYKILLRLQANGRESNAEIARVLDVSEGTIRRRIKRLIDDDVIRVTAVPNPWKIGFEAVALIGLQVELDKMDQVANKLAEMSEVHFVSLTTGTYDIFIWVMVPTAEDLGSFIKTKLAGITGITRSETFINLEIRKRTFGWLS